MHTEDRTETKQNSLKSAGCSLKKTTQFAPDNALSDQRRAVARQDSLTVEHGTRISSNARKLVAKTH